MSAIIVLSRFMLVITAEVDFPQELLVLLRPRGLLDPNMFCLLVNPKSAAAAAGLTGADTQQVLLEPTLLSAAAALEPDLAASIPPHWTSTHSGDTQ